MRFLTLWRWRLHFKQKIKAGTSSADPAFYRLGYNKILKVFQRDFGLGVFSVEFLPDRLTFEYINIFSDFFIYTEFIQIKYNPTSL